MQGWSKCCAEIWHNWLLWQGKFLSRSYLGNKTCPLSTAFFFAYGKIPFIAPIAQWTERQPPELKSAVRVCVGVPKQPP